MKPNKEHIKMWVKALRSGKYKQGRGQLSFSTGNKGDHHCCLGIACIVAKENGLPLKVIRRPSGNIAYGGTVSVLPRRVAKWLGLPQTDPEIGPRSNPSMVASAANDTAQLSFKQIARLIENRYLK